MKQERYRLVNICKKACCSNRGGKNLNFWPYLRRKIWTILFINFTFFKLETQNGNAWSTAKTILRLIKFKFKIYRPVSYLLYDLDANLVFRLSGYTANYKIQKLSWRILILKKVFFGISCMYLPISWGGKNTGKTAIISQFLYDEHKTDYKETLEEMYR